MCDAETQNVITVYTNLYTEAMNCTLRVLYFVELKDP